MPKLLICPRPQKGGGALRCYASCAGVLGHWHGFWGLICWALKSRWWGCVLCMWPSPPLETHIDMTGKFPIFNRKYIDSDSFMVDVRLPVVSYFKIPILQVRRNLGSHNYSQQQWPKNHLNLRDMTSMRLFKKHVSWVHCWFARSFVWSECHWALVAYSLSPLFGGSISSSPSSVCIRIAKDCTEVCRLTPLPTSSKLLSWRIEAL